MRDAARERSGISANPIPRVAAVGSGDRSGRQCVVKPNRVAGANLTAWHTTLARNTGGDGSGVCLDDNSAAAITNTILVSQTVAITATAGNTATLEGTLWGSGDWANTAKLGHIARAGHRHQTQHGNGD